MYLVFWFLKEVWNLLICESVNNYVIIMKKINSNLSITALIEEMLSQISAAKSWFKNIALEIIWNKSLFKSQGIL